MNGAGERLQSSGGDTAERIAEALKQCEELIDHFARKANSSKRSFALLRYSTIVLTVGIATIAAVPSVPRGLVAILSGIAATQKQPETASPLQSLARIRAVKCFVGRRNCGWSATMKSRRRHVNVEIDGLFVAIVQAPRGQEVFGKNA